MKINPIVFIALCMLSIGFGVIIGNTADNLTTSQLGYVTTDLDIFDKAVKPDTDRFWNDVDIGYYKHNSTTYSMYPTFTNGNYIITVRDFDKGDIEEGVIIGYKSDENGNTIILHRVIEESYDDEGVYYKAKGDNNKLIDDKKIRFEDVEFVVAGVIY